MSKFGDKLANRVENITLFFCMSYYVLTLGLIISEGLRDCDNVDFNDIKSSSRKICVTNNGIDMCDMAEVFTMDEDITTSVFRNQMKIKDINGDITGYFFEKSDGKDNKFRFSYIDKDENKDYVVATIRKSSFAAITRYKFKRCDDSGSTYEIRSQIGYNEGDYQLFRDNKLIAVSSSFTEFVCRPDVTFTYVDSDMPLAVITKECGTIESSLVDKWVILNYNQTLVDNYVFGFMGYISTFEEED